MLNCRRRSTEGTRRRVRCLCSRMEMRSVCSVRWRMQQTWQTPFLPCVAWQRISARRVRRRCSSDRRRLAVREGGASADSVEEERATNRTCMWRASRSSRIQFSVFIAVRKGRVAGCTRRTRSRGRFESSTPDPGTWSIHGKEKEDQCGFVTWRARTTVPRRAGGKCRSCSYRGSRIWQVNRHNARKAEASQESKRVLREHLRVRVARALRRRCQLRALIVGWARNRGTAWRATARAEGCVPKHYP